VVYHLGLAYVLTARFPAAAQTYRALLFYKGVRTEAQVLPDEAFKENTGVTVGYGLANYSLAEGQTAKACALMRRLVEDEAHWNAFGFIGAEAELTRANGPCAAQAGPHVHDAIFIHLQSLMAGVTTPRAPGSSARCRHRA
jgi:hypothetical protein